MDNLTPQQRSALMSRIRGSDTLPERLLRSNLHRRGWRFRKNLKRLPGSPDIVFPSRRAVVFVDGDFWHGYRLKEWRHKLNDFWLAKIENNRRRDRRNGIALRREGWVVLRIWEHEVIPDVDRAAQKVERWLIRLTNANDS